MFYGTVMANRIDNDETKGLAVPFLVLAHVRTGGTFCCHALSNHALVFCDREETVHHLSTWRKVGDMKPGRILRVLWSLAGYRATGVRMIYTQAFHPRVWPVIEEVQPRIIHLRRRSLIRQGLSQAYQQAVRAGMLAYHPVHSFEEKKPPAATINPKFAAYWVRKIEKENKRGLERMAAYSGAVLDVFYEDMVAVAETGSADRMEEETMKGICEFLGVEPAPLRVDLRRDFPVPTRELFVNWEEVASELEKAGFGGLDG
jgi:hypothetical protein